MAVSWRDIEMSLHLDFGIAGDQRLQVRRVDGQEYDIDKIRQKKKKLIVSVAAKNIKTFDSPRWDL